SDEFFSYQSPKDFRLETRKVEPYFSGNGVHPPKDYGTAEFLRFTSPVTSPYPENNVANARWFPASSRRAVVILPQWNADALSHNGLGRILNRFGVAALRLSMPYHDVRRPAELQRA